jgi:hypothetical protein
MRIDTGQVNISCDPGSGSGLLTNREVAAKRAQAASGYTEREHIKSKRHQPSDFPDRCHLSCQAPVGDARLSDSFAR